MSKFMRLARRTNSHLEVFPASIKVNQYYQMIRSRAIGISPCDIPSSGHRIARSSTETSISASRTAEMNKMLSVMYAFGLSIEKSS